MICKRCGSDCPESPDGYCFHCHVGIEVGLVDSATMIPVKGIQEGFPDFVASLDNSLIHKV